jgi:hypothetical protein
MNPFRMLHKLCKHHSTSDVSDLICIRSPDGIPVCCVRIGWSELHRRDHKQSYDRLSTHGLTRQRYATGGVGGKQTELISEWGPNDLSVEEEPPNSLQYEDRHDQSCAHNDKQQTENCDDKHPVASSRSRGRGRVPAEQFVVAHVRLEPERKRIAQPRNYPDQLVDQDVHCHPREQNFRNTASRCVNKRHRRNYCGGYVADSGKQTDNWIQAKAAFCPGKAQQIIHDERKPSEKGFKRGTCPLAAGSVFGRQNFPLRHF